MATGLAAVRAAAMVWKRNSDRLQIENQSLERQLEEQRDVSKRLLQQLPKALRADLCGFLHRPRIQKLREERAALRIQTAFRGYIARKKKNSVRTALLAIQNHFRGRQAKMDMQYQHAVLKIQSLWRGQQVRQRFQADRKKLIRIQCQVRKWLAKRRLRELKIEARSVGHLQKVNTGLENKIIQLQQRLDSVTTVSHLQAQVMEVQSERDQLLKWKNKAVELEQDIKRLETDCDVKEAEKARLKSEIDQMSYRMDTMGAEHNTVLQQIQDQLGLESQKTLELQLMLQKAETLLSEANGRRIQAEKDVVQMKEQLLANANLLASPAFSREGSVRRDGPMSSGSHTSVHGEDMDDITLIMRHQKSISELRTINDKYTREIEHLRSLGGAKDPIISMKARNSQREQVLQRIEDLEKASQNVRSILQPVVARRGVPRIEQDIYANARLWRDSAVVRACMHSIPHTECATRDHEGGHSKMDERTSNVVWPRRTPRRRSSASAWICPGFW